MIAAVTAGWLMTNVLAGPPSVGARIPAAVDDRASTGTDL
jgi:hypothetical protein